jgi:hypothetical protein
VASRRVWCVAAACGQALDAEGSASQADTTDTVLVRDLDWDGTGGAGASASASAIIVSSQYYLLRAPGQANFIALNGSPGASSSCNSGTAVFAVSPAQYALVQGWITAHTPFNVHWTCTIPSGSTRGTLVGPATFTLPATTLSTTHTATAIQLSWEGSPTDVYSVYRNNVLIATVHGTGYTDDVGPAVGYYYRVALADGSRSNLVAGATPFPTPTIITGWTEYWVLTVAWRPVPGADSYLVSYRDLTVPGGIETRRVDGATQIQISNGRPDHVYAISVAAGHTNDPFDRWSANSAEIQLMCAEY